MVHHHVCVMNGKSSPNETTITFKSGSLDGYIFGITHQLHASTSPQLGVLSFEKAVDLRAIALM